MNPYLAAMYNTHGYGDAVAEEQTKVAHLDTFCKAAAAEGIDLSQLAPEQREALYNEFTTKLAEEEEGEEEGGGPPTPPKKEEDDEEEESEDKEAAARAEYAAQQEWQQKVAEADFLGRQMAHAFVQERDSIEKQAGKAGDYVRKLKGAVEETAGHLHRAKGSRKQLRAAKKSGLGEVLGGRYKSEAKEHMSKAMQSAKPLAAPAAVVGGVGATGAAGAAGYAAGRKGKKDDGEKTSSAFDEQAYGRAFEIAKEAGYDENEAVERLNALYTLVGSPEQTKTASADAPFDTALSVRGLELLEHAGYPVDWDAANEALSS